MGSPSPSLGGNSERHLPSTDTRTSAAAVVAKYLSSTPDAIKKLVERLALPRDIDLSQLAASQTSLPPLTSERESPAAASFPSSILPPLQSNASRTSLPPLTTSSTVDRGSSAAALSSFPSLSLPPLQSAASSAATESMSTPPVNQALLNLAMNIALQNEVASSEALPIPTLVSENLLKHLLYMKLASVASSVRDTLLPAAVPVPTFSANLWQTHVQPAAAVVDLTESKCAPAPHSSSSTSPAVAAPLPTGFSASPDNSSLQSHVRAHSVHSAHAHAAHGILQLGGASSSQHSSSSGAIFGESSDTFPVLFPELPGGDSVAAAADSLAELSDAAMTDEIIKCINELCLEDQRLIGAGAGGNAALAAGSGGNAEEAITHDGIDSLNALTQDLISSLPDVSLTDGGNSQ